MDLRRILKGIKVNFDLCHKSRQELILTEAWGIVFYLVLYMLFD